MRYNKREYEWKNHKLTCETRGQKDGKIIAGLVQMDSGPDMNENMRMAEQYVREAAEQGAKLILFPETAEYTGADMPGHASAVPGT